KAARWAGIGNVVIVDFGQTRVADGQYRCRIVDVWGEEFLHWRLQTGRGDAMGVSTPVVGWNKCELKQFLEAVGIRCRGEVTIDLDLMIGRELGVRVNDGVFSYFRLGG